MSDQSKSVIDTYINESLKWYYRSIFSVLRLRIILSIYTILFLSVAVYSAIVTYNFVSTTQYQKIIMKEDHDIDKYRSVRLIAKSYESDPDIDVADYMCRKYVLQHEFMPKSQVWDEYIKNNSSRRVYEDFKKNLAMRRGESKYPKKSQIKIIHSKVFVRNKIPISSHIKFIVTEQGGKIHNYTVHISIVFSRISLVMRGFTDMKFSVTNYVIEGV